MAMTGPVYPLDIFRLLSCAKMSGSAGNDQADIAYAEYLPNGPSKQTQSRASYLYGRMDRIRVDPASAFIHVPSSPWSYTGKVEIMARSRWEMSFALLWGHLPRRPGIVHLPLSYSCPVKSRTIEKFLKRTSRFFVPTTHNVMQLNVPERGRPRKQKRPRLKSVPGQADDILVPLDAIRHDLVTILRDVNNLPIWALPHSTFSVGVYKAGCIIPEQPFPVYASVIEPRKNRMTLFHAWGKMVETALRSAWTLVLAGKREGGNENIVDRSASSCLLWPILITYNGPLDGETCVSPGKEGTRFSYLLTEGYGQSVAEGLCVGVPVIRSNISALRKIGTQAQERIDLLNGTVWSDIIIEYMRNSLRRRSRLQQYMQTNVCVG